MNSPEEIRSIIVSLNPNLDRLKLIRFRKALSSQDPYDIANKIALATLIAEDKSEDFTVESIEILDEVINYSSGKSLSAYLAKASILARGSSFSEAESVCHDALRLHPSNYWPDLRIADILRMKEDFTSAKATIINAASSKTDGFANQNFTDAFLQVLESEHGSGADSKISTFSRGSPISNLLAVYLVKNEEDIIYANLCHHFGIGIRNFVIIENSSVDSTLNNIQTFRKEFPSANVYVICDPEPGYYQAAKTNAAFRMADEIIERGGTSIDWVLPIDADEFICTSGRLGFSELLSAVQQRGSSAVAFNMHNAGTSLDGAASNTSGDFLARFDLRKSPPSANVFKILAKKSVNGKRARFGEGNHNIENGYRDLGQFTSAAEFGYYILHLPLRSTAQVKSKILNGYAALQAAPRLTGTGGHWRKWYQQYEAKGEIFFSELFEKFNEDLRR